VAFAAPRVITLSPANTELAFAAGITPVGVSSFPIIPAGRALNRLPPGKG
jgi:vitamin B12 transport system substrate-binding protein